MTFYANKLKQVKIFMFLSFALKIAFSNFFSLKQTFLSTCGLAISSFALNTELVLLEAIKK